MKKVFLSKSVDETVALGHEWGTRARLGQIFALNGDLGAGKTQLVRGLAKGLGFGGRVQSPTFALINIYEGARLPLYHMDLYRLDSSAAVRTSGLEEYLENPEGVAVVEWADRWFGHGPYNSEGDIRMVELEVLGPDERRISYENIGA